VNRAIEPKTEWIDKKGKALTVLSVDYDNETLVYNRPDSPKCEKTVSIEVFIKQVKPKNHQSSPVKEKSIKPTQPPSVWIDETLDLNFGKSLQLQHQDWLERGMHAKTVKFDIGGGGLPPEVNWEDHCAAIAMIDHPPAKALASILLWGSDTNWNWSRQFDDVVHHLADNMVGRCKKEGRSEPKACTHTLPDLARLMARMVLHFELYQLWDMYTVKGRLLFSGIEVNASTYTNAWLTYQRQMTLDLFDMVGKADQSIGSYRAQLNRVDDNA